MPLGNLTSQFFANVYLDELDHFIKHKLKARYYIRYVDDFVIFNSNRYTPVKQKENINQFLKKRLAIELHPDKSKIIQINKRINLLGFRVFYYYKLLKKPNLRKMGKRFEILKEQHKRGKIDFDIIYDFFEGWFAYAKHANTYKLRKKLAEEIERSFPHEISTKEVNRMTKKP